MLIGSSRSLLLLRLIAVIALVFFEQLFEDLSNSAEKCLNVVHKTVTRVPASHYQSGNRRVRVHDGMNS